MTRLDTAIQSLVQGVSQQSRRDRLPGQGVRQENVSPDVVFGLRPRPSTQFRKVMLSTAADPSSVTQETLNVQDKLVRLFMQDGAISAFDELGDPYVINVDPAVDTSYLVGATTIARSAEDAIVLVNRAIKPAMDETSSPLWRTQDKTVQFLGGNFGTLYTMSVRVGSETLIEYNYQTPDGSDQEHIHYVSARAASRVFFRALRQNIASGTTISPFQTTGANAGEPTTAGVTNRAWVDEAIGFDGAALIDYTPVASGNFGTQFQVFWAEDCLLVVPRDTVDPIWDHEVQVNDGVGGVTVAIVGTSISSLDELTKFGSNGQVTRVIGEGENGTDFFMRFSLVAEASLGTDDWLRTISDSGSPNGTASNSGTAGSPDNDALVGTTGGSDNVYFNGPRSNYDLYKLPGRADWLIVRDLVGSDGVDVVNQRVETINFTDENNPWSTYSQQATLPPDDFFDLEVDFTGDPDIDFGKRGIWVEATAPYEYHTYDLDTMPLVLTLDQDTEEFNLTRGEWIKRRAGGDVANPPPEFVGRTIEDVQVFQSRLVILAGPYVIMSRTGKYLDFWNQSASFSAADDPITITSTARRSAIMRSLVPHNRDLVVFSDRAQFFVSGRTAITPANASLALTTTYSSDQRAIPGSTGSNILFGAVRGGFMEFYEFFVQGDTAENTARSVTAHVTQYIKGIANQIEVSNNDNLVLITTDNNLKEVYAYDYLWLDEEKVQSAWSKWVFPYDVTHVHFEQDELSFTMRQGDDYFLVVSSLERIDNPVLGYELALDIYETVTGVATEVATQAPFQDLDRMYVIQGEGCPNPGIRATIVDQTGSTINIREDLGGGTVYVGQQIERVWEPTMPVMRDQNGIAIGTGSFTVDTFFLNFQRTGQISVDISSEFRDTSAVEFDGRFLGRSQAVIGIAGIADGVLEIPFHEDPDLATFTVSSDDPRPFYIVDLEYSSNFIKRGRRT